MNVKVLKSFVSAHEAVNWLTQNRIEDTSIETTGTLKSMGMGPVPSGNYHVVLKGRASQARDEIASGERTAFRAEADLGVEHPYDVSAKFNDTRAGGRRAERLRKVDEAVDPNLPKKGEAGSLEHFEEWAASKHADWPYDDLTHYADEHGLTDEEFDKFEYHMEKTKAVSSISPEELTKVITKAIMGVLKSKDVSVDTTEIKQENPTNKKPSTQPKSESVVREVVPKESLFPNARLIDGSGRKLSPEQEENSRKINEWIKRDFGLDFTKAITKAVMDVLKNQPKKLKPGTPEHYAEWLNDLNHEDWSRTDKQNPLIDYAESYGEELEEYIGGDENRYEHFYDVYP